jgi:hypothetical protein
MATIIQFSRNIRKIGSKIQNNSVNLVKSVSKQTLRDLVDGTPVDTGEARSNWRVSIGGQKRNIIPPHYPGEKLGLQEKRNARETISEGIKEINTLRVGQFKRGTGQAGSSVKITNNVPYIDDLRRGTSKQQPNDWVERAFSEARNIIVQAKLMTTVRSD